MRLPIKTQGALYRVFREPSRRIAVRTVGSAVEKELHREVLRINSFYFVERGRCECHTRWPTSLEPCGPQAITHIDVGGYAHAPAISCRSNRGRPRSLPSSSIPTARLPKRSLGCQGRCSDI